MSEGITVQNDPDGEFGLRIHYTPQRGLDTVAPNAPHEASSYLNHDNPRLFAFVPGRPEPVDLSEIQARADAATPGPWENHYHDGDSLDELASFFRKALSFAPDRLRIEIVATGGPDDDGICGPDVLTTAITGNGPTSLANAEFIARAREDVPLLIAAIKHLASEHQDTVKSLIRADRTTEVFDAEVDRLERENAWLQEHNRRLTWALRAIDTRLHAERDGGLNLVAGGYWEQGRHYRFVTSRTLEQMCNVAVSATAERPVEAVAAQGGEE